MPDLHQLVDQIRSFVESNDQTRSPMLDNLASAYAEACAEVNQRLGRCLRLLQQGLRSEAIQLAEHEPKLLDASTALDFPERAAWDELVSIYGLASGAGVQVEAAKSLKAAYAEQEPLQDLLRSHRRLALQRSPVWARIAVMRQLAASDPKNAIWVDDLRTFEQARLREIQTDAAEALRRRDGPQLAKLMGELKGQTWLQPPPKALVQRLRKADAELRKLESRAALADVENRLNEAFAARDLVVGRAARKDWENLKSAAALDQGDPIWNRTRPIFDWLSEQDRRDKADHDYSGALAALLNLLDKAGYVAPTTLERAARAVLSHGRGMPEDLQRLYVSRIQSAQSTRRKRFWIIGSATAAATLVAGGLLIYVVRNQMRAAEADQDATQLTALVDRDDLEGAARFIQSLAPELLTYQSLVEAREHYQAAEKQENDRKSQFEGALRELEDAPLSELNPPAILRARTAKRRLEPGQAEDEQAIQQALGRRLTKREDQEGRNDTLVSPLLDRAERDIEWARQQLEGGANSRQEIRDAIDNARQQVEGQRSNLRLASRKVRERAGSLGEQIEQQKIRLDTLDRKERLEGKISETVSYALGDAQRDVAGFATCLERYSKQFPQEPDSDGIRRSLKEQHLWQAIEAWNVLAADWKNHSGPLTPRDAKVRSERCDRFLTDYPSFPGVPYIGAYQRYLRAIGKRALGEESPAAKLRNLMSDRLIDNVTMLAVSSEVGIDKPEKRYYGYEIGRDESIIRFKYFVDFNSESSKPFNRHTAFPTPSPQSSIAKRFKRELSDSSKIAEWEPLIISLFDAILHEPKIDPILQVKMLRMVLDAGSEGSEPIRELLEAQRITLARFAESVNVSWMNPDDEKVGPKRAAAAEFVQQQIRDLDQSRQKILDRRSLIERNVRHFYRSVGWLSRDNHGWQLRRVSLPGQGDLWVAALRAEKLPGDWKKVGEIANGEPRLHASDSSVLIEGRPVFIRVLW
jgi:hypothetical protein